MSEESEGEVQDGQREEIRDEIHESEDIEQEEEESEEQE
jgi:hypothetical protein